MTEVQGFLSRCCGSICALKPIQTIKTVTRENIRSSNILPPDHGGVLLDSRLQQPLQDGPFPHGGREVLTPSRQGTSGQVCCGPPSSSPSRDGPEKAPLLLSVTFVSDLGTSDPDLWPPASWVWQSNALLPGRSHFVSSPPLLEERR